MRGIEADIRKSKDEINALSALGGNEAKIKELKTRIKTFQSKYDEISGVTGIAKEKRRLTVQKPKNVLTNASNGGKVNIEIDELTPCLRRMKDGKIVNTKVIEISPNKKDFSNWEFDWTLPQKTGHSVYAIKADGDERIQGLVAMKSDKGNLAYHIDIVESAPFNNPHHKSYIKKEYDGVGGHLFAEAVRKSYEDGFGGAVYFTAKSDLIEHYQKELGAILTNPRQRIMFIDERAARKLYERYYGGKMQ